MKTRSQTKKEKAGILDRKIPQLNEDVLGIILKHVVQKEQREIMKSFEVIRKHFYWFLESDDKLHTAYISDRCPDQVEWPDYLNSNSRRLIHHTNVKLLWSREILIHAIFMFHVPSKRQLDLLWKTFKHFGRVYLTWQELYNSPEEPMYHTTKSVAWFFRWLWPVIQRRDSLIQKLENKAT